MKIRIKQLELERNNTLIKPSGEIIGQNPHGSLHSSNTNLMNFLCKQVETESEVVNTETNEVNNECNRSRMLSSKLYFMFSD